MVDVMMMKGALIVLLFAGTTELKPFTYTPQDYDMDSTISPEEIVLSCSEEAERLYPVLAEHSWTDPRGQGWYLRDRTGTLQGSIC